MKKSNIRSVRFSDDMMDLINQQVGENFTQKFERLVYNAYMTYPEKKRQCDELDRRIEMSRKQLFELRDTYQKLSSLSTSVARALSGISERLCEYDSI